MRWEHIDEPVKVRADFQGGVVSPVLVRRGSRRAAIRSVNTRWEDGRGRRRVCFFSVTTDSGDVWQLAFDTADLCWRLQYVLLDG